MRVRSRRVLATSLATAVALTAATLLDGAAQAGSAASAFVNAINKARAAHGLAPYAVAVDLQPMARAQAGRMAAQLAISHNPDLAAQGGDWRSLGENVGVGGDAASLAAAFLASPEHRANILSSTYTQVVVATAIGSDGRLYVDEVFRLPMATAAAATRPVQAKPTTPTGKPTTKPTARPTPARSGATARATRARGRSKITGTPGHPTRRRAPVTPTTQRPATPTASATSLGTPLPPPTAVPAPG